MSERDDVVPVLVATATVHGPSLPQITVAANETFRNLTELPTAEFERQYLVVVDVAEPDQKQTTLGGDTLIATWRAECHLYHAPVPS